MTNAKRFLRASSLALVVVAVAAVPGYAGNGPKDKVPPKTPRDLAVTGVTSTSISLRWSPSRDNKDKLAVEYGVYRNGTRVLTTATTQATIPADCETRYALAVDAVDDAGNRSDKTAGVPATTGTCPDLTPPSVPTNLVVKSATQTSVTLGWSPSVDAKDGSNVTYGVYRGDTRIMSVNTPEATISGLECGHSYPFEVDSADTKDNRSAHASINAPTAECPRLNTFVSPAGTDFLRRWNHLAVTYDGAMLRVYQDGVEQVALPTTGSIPTSGAPLRIGGDALFNEFFRGRLDEARIYSRPLSAAEIAQDMTTPISVRAGQSGLVGAFGFDEGTGTSTRDASDSGPAGVLAEGVKWTTEGRYGSGLLFDTDSWVTVADRNTLDLTTGMTLEAWVDPTELGSWRTVMTKEAEDGNEYYGLFASTDHGGLPEGDVFVNGGYAQARSPMALSLNTCKLALPCASISAAYQAAPPGGLVEVAGGTYPLQTIRGTKAAPGVVVRPADGATVTVEGFDVFADNIELRDFTGDYFAVNADSDGFTARHLDVGPVFIYGASNVRVLDSDIGPSFAPGNSPVSYITYGDRSDGARTAPENVLLDNVDFHDFKRGNDVDHMECLHVAGGNGITIRNSRFIRCDVFSIFFTEWAGPEPPKNVLVENNFFDESTLDGKYPSITPDLCCTYYAIKFGDALSKIENFTLRYNSALSSFGLTNVPKSDVRFVANVAPLQGCDENVFYAYNVWDGEACGATDKNAPSGFVDALDPTNRNLHLAPGSAAIGAGDPSDFPAKDIDGQSRPQGGAPDAGADETG